MITKHVIVFNVIFMTCQDKFVTKLNKIYSHYGAVLLKVHFLTMILTLMKLMQKKFVLHKIPNDINGVLQCRQMYEAPWLNQLSVTRRNCEFPVKIFAKNLQRLKMHNVSGAIPMKTHQNHGYLPWELRYTFLTTGQDCARQYSSPICENGYIFDFRISMTPGQGKVRGIVCDENQDGTTMFSVKNIRLTRGKQTL